MDKSKTPLTPLQTRDLQREINKNARADIWKHLDSLSSDYKQMFRNPNTVTKVMDKGTRYTLNLLSKWKNTEIIFEGIWLRDTTKGYMGWTRISYFLFDNLNNICYERSLIQEFQKKGANDNNIDLVFPDMS